MEPVGRAQPRMDPDSAVNWMTVKEETKLVLEAFLKRSLSQEEGSGVGHVGRVYHDPKKYSFRTSRDGHHEAPHKHPARPSERKGCKPPAREKEGGRSGLRSGSWGSLHEEINRVEEKKHGFKTNIKQLLQRHSHAKEKGGTLKLKGSSTPSKSRNSLDGVLDEPGRGAGLGDSLKRPKNANPFMACTMAGSRDSLGPPEEQRTAPGKEKPASLGAQRKSSKAFSFKTFLKKKSSQKDADRDHNKVPPSSPRPTTLPVTPCYKPEPDHPHGRRPAAVGVPEDPGIYTMAAKQLDLLVRHQKVHSPTGEIQSPAFPFPAKKQQAPEGDKEEVVRRLVALLQEQAVVINQQIEEDPMLRGALSRMSYRSFSRLAEVFTSQAEVPAPEVMAVSPELTKIALTMELTRKVAGINSHAVQTLMGYSMQYMDMFVPWLQQQGGWENIVCQGDSSEFALD